MTTVIGISGSVLLDPIYSPVIIKRSYVNEQYVEAIAQEGAVPFIIPVTDPSYIPAFIARIDGLLLSGGYDVNPYEYGEETLSRAGESYPERDFFEKALLLEAVAQGKPVLGVCRGAQVINVTYGGSLYQDVTYASHAKLQHLQATDGAFPVHDVKLTNDSCFAKIFDKEVIGVNSFHHQLIKELAPGFKATGKTSDGVIEALEKEGDLFVAGVQWHPEQMYHQNDDMKRLFRAFIEFSTI